MRFAYYPGCTSKGSTQEVDLASRSLARHLGIDLVELSDAGCCGSCEIKAVNPDLHLMLNARILSMAGQRGLEILTVCDTCQANLLGTARKLDQDSLKRSAIIQKLSTAGVSYTPAPRTRHFTRILMEEFGEQKLAEKVLKPLGDLRVATFACCHTFRGDGKEAKNLGLLERLTGVTGATVIPVRADGDCCGFHILMVNEELAARAAGKFLTRCKDAEVDCVVTSSPLCHAALDIYQKSAEAASGRNIRIPILHVEQILALSMGIGPKHLGLERHIVSAERLVERAIA